MSKFWKLFIILLIVFIAAGSVVIWLRYNPGEPIEISLTQDETWQGKIYIDGAVNSPGIFPLNNSDSIGDLIQAAGGISENGSTEELSLHVPVNGETSGAQKIDINRADAWLLEALPGIGETLARRIVDYRLENGPYRSTSEITRVPGIGDSIYDQIKDLITVAD